MIGYVLAWIALLAWIWLLFFRGQFWMIERMPRPPELKTWPTVVALIPASLLTIAGGAVFGLVRGAIYALIAATLGSTIAFLLGRYIVRRFVAKRLEAMPRLSAIEHPSAIAT